MKNWMLISLIVLGATTARAQMSVELHDAEPEDQISADSEMDDTFAEIDHAEQTRKARSEAAQRAREHAALLAEQRAEEARARRQAQIDAQRDAQQRLVRRRVVTQTTWTVAQNQPPQPQYYPNGQPVRRNVVPSNQPLPPPQPTYTQREMEREWLPQYRRTGITLIPTVIVADSITESDYISSTANGGNLSHNSRFDWGLGLMAEFGRSMFTFETGLLYFQESVNASYSFNNSFGGYGQVTGLNDSATLGYMGVPLVGKLNLSPLSEKSRFNISAGVIPAFLTNSSLSYQQNTSTGTLTNVTDPNSPLVNMGGFRSFNVFSTVGVGGDFVVGVRKDVRGELSWRRALMSETNNSTTTVDSFLLSLGFGLDI